MKNFFKIILLGGVVLALFIFLKNFYIDNNIVVKDEKIGYSEKYKGLKGAVDIVSNNQGDFYIAYKDRIQLIDAKGKSYDILKNKTLNIKSLEYKDNILYYSSDTKVYSYNLAGKEEKVIINALPNLGDYKDSIIRIKGNELYVSIGAATNSGVVGRDNEWLKDNPYYCDISPKDITIKGRTYGNEKTGAFVPYMTKNASGQVISAHSPGNASIVQYNMENGNLETYAWGIRNAKGMAFNSEGKLIATIGGMEDRGLRPVKGDVDYIYEIKKGLWYGWPDYSGGDPLTSPRFKGVDNNKLNFILDNHPTTNPPAPIYQHKSLSSLGSMNVDTKGILGEKNCIYFYDTRDNTIYKLTNKGVLSEMLELKDASFVSSIKFNDNSMLMLDSAKGVLYSISKQNSSPIFSLSNDVMYYLIIIVLIGIITAVWKFNYNNNK